MIRVGLTAAPRGRDHPRRPSRASKMLLSVGLLAALAIAPLFVYPVFLMKALCFALFACAFNLLAGYGGLLSFGHAAFFGSSAYLTAHALAKWGVSPEAGIAIGTATAAIMGLIFGWLAIRRQGIYFSMVTLALAQMVFFVALQAPFTGGEDGIQSVPQGQLFGLFSMSDGTQLYAFVVLVFCLGFGLVYRIVNSPFGEVLAAIRQNEQRAESLGYDVARCKLLTFVLSATLAGLAGATKVLVFQVASLTDVQWHMSGDVVLMALVGGMGTLFGPVVGAFFITGIQSYLAFLGGWLTVLQGVIFIVCVLAFRRGVVGEAARVLQRHRAHTGADER